MHVPIRAGADIAFLGGIINHVLSNGLDFREYVLAYSNAAQLVGEDFVDTEDLDGLFSGYDEDKRTYDPTSWAMAAAEAATAASARDGQPTPARCERAGEGRPRRADRDETLQDPRCVYQVLKRHFARYTPEMVAERLRVRRPSCSSGSARR